MMISPICIPIMPSTSNRTRRPHPPRRSGRQSRPPAIPSPANRTTGTPTAQRTRRRRRGARIHSHRTRRSRPLQPPPRLGQPFLVLHDRSMNGEDPIVSFFSRCREDSRCRLVGLRVNDLEAVGVPFFFDWQATVFVAMMVMMTDVGEVDESIERIFVVPLRWWLWLLMGILRGIRPFNGHDHGIFRKNDDIGRKGHSGSSMREEDGRFDEVSWYLRQRQSHPTWLPPPHPQKIISRPLLVKPSLHDRLGHRVFHAGFTTTTTTTIVRRLFFLLLARHFQIFLDIVSGRTTPAMNGIDALANHNHARVLHRRSFRRIAVCLMGKATSDAIDAREGHSLDETDADAVGAIFSDVGAGIIVIVDIVVVVGRLQGKTRQHRRLIVVAIRTTAIATKTMILSSSSHNTTDNILRILRRIHRILRHTPPKHAPTPRNTGASTGFDSHAVFDGTKRRRPTIPIGNDAPPRRMRIRQRRRLFAALPPAAAAKFSEADVPPTARTGLEFLGGAGGRASDGGGDGVFVG
mmetsp:Transcript_6960/g.15291  ORF Transcript_6960/g.15291 Transcript_6960/m.15291 type:complete len:520 (-) Transcript_6960:689-2248(-)